MNESSLKEENQKNLANHQTPSEEQTVLSETIMNKDYQQAKLSSALEMNQRYVNRQKELEATITEVKEKEKIAIGLLDQKIQSFVEDSTKLKEADKNMPTLKFMEEQCQILENYLNEMNKKPQLDIELLKSYEILEVNDDVDDIPTAIKRLTRKVHRKRKQEKSYKDYMYPFEEDFDEDTLKRRIVFLTVAGKQAIEKNKQEKEELLSIIQELQDDIDHYSEYRSSVKSHFSSTKSSRSFSGIPTIYSTTPK